jgi:hydroxymethylglutaryl-CoA lyase
MPTAEKIAWCVAEAVAGVREIEVCSFAPPKLIAQFADAAEVAAAARAIPSLTVSALVPNAKGAERALEAGVDQITYVVSASESHNRANVRRSRQASIDEFAPIAALVKGREATRRPLLSVGLATAFGCAIEGRVEEAEVCALAAHFAAAGADQIALADTVGYADPAAVRRLFKAVAGQVGAERLSAHFHDTRGLGLANVLAALDVGVRRFDGSLGGLGGCPFAPGATGNIVTEDLVFMLESMGLATGVDLPALVAVRAILARSLPGVALHGAVAKAGIPKGMEPWSG